MPLRSRAIQSAKTTGRADNCLWCSSCRCTTDKDPTTGLSRLDRHRYVAPAHHGEDGGAPMTPPQRNPEDRPVGALLAPDILALLDESPGDIPVETEEIHP